MIRKSNIFYSILYNYKIKFINFTIQMAGMVTIKSLGINVLFLS
jgi:hypothetical protein